MVQWVKKEREVKEVSQENRDHRYTCRHKDTDRQAHTKQSV